MISTKGRYGLRVMVDLAEHKAEGFITLTEIAQRQDISKKYLEIIMKKLMDGKLVTSLSGKGGGYCLARDPDQYTICEILENMEDTLAPVACLREGAAVCDREGGCKTLPLWKEYNQVVQDFLSSKTLADLL